MRSTDRPSPVAAGMDEPGGTGAPRVVRAGNRSAMTLDGTRTFIVGRTRPLVIDPGPEDPAHLDAVIASLAGETPRAILLTHSHRDHAGNASALADRTGARVWGARAETGGGGATEPLEEGAVFEAGEGRVVALATPGHSADHYAFVWTGGGAPRGGAVFVGDLMLGLGTTTFVGSPGGSVRDYLRSLDRLEALDPELLYPAHGPPLSDPATAIRRYREHRLARIAQVEARLRESPQLNPGELVEAIYGRLGAGLQKHAEDSVRAILEYLAA